MSTTEKEALEAGDSWWEQEIFRGNPNWDSFKKISLSTLNDEELSFLDKETKHLTSQLNSWQIDYTDHKLPDHILKEIRTNGFLGLHIAKEYNGKAFSSRTNSCINMRVSAQSSIAATIIMVCNSLGPGELISHYGSDEQKKYYLPRLADGTELPCFGLTGPLAGSDAANTPDTGVVCHGDHNGKQVLGLNLTFFKRYITLSPIATVVGLAIRVTDPDHLLGDIDDLGITCCLLPADTLGIDIGKRHWPNGAPWYNGPIRGENIFIPLDWIIGGADRIGQGWKMLNDCLAIGRAVSLPTLGTTQSILSYLTTSAYVTVREQFNLPIGKLDGVKEAMAQIGGLAYINDATLQLTIAAVDQGLKPSVASAISKYHLTENARTTVNHALDIHAGKGVQNGPRNYLSPLYDSVPISITVEGANILTRNLIIFGQGSIRCHPYAFKELQIANIEDTKEALKALDSIVYSHIGYTLHNAVNTFIRGLTRGIFIKTPAKKSAHNSLARYYQHISRMSSAFAFTADVAMITLGGALKRKERLSARLGDIMSYLYMASAVIKYYEHHGELECDLPIAKWSLEYCLYHAQEAMYDFYHNLPNKALGKFLWRYCFIFGRSFKKPDDKLDHLVADTMQQDNKLRERFVNYFDFSDDDQYAKLEQARNAIIQARPLQQRLKDAIKTGSISKRLPIKDQIQQAVSQNYLSQEEAQLLLESETYRWDMIQVDEFDYDLTSVVN